MRLLIEQGSEAVALLAEGAHDLGIVSQPCFELIVNRIKDVEDPCAADFRQFEAERMYRMTRSSCSGRRSRRRSGRSVGRCCSGPPGREVRTAGDLCAIRHFILFAPEGSRLGGRSLIPSALWSDEGFCPFYSSRKARWRCVGEGFGQVGEDGPVPGLDEAFDRHAGHSLAFWSRRVRRRRRRCGRDSVYARARVRHEVGRDAAYLAFELGRGALVEGRQAQHRVEAGWSWSMSCGETLTSIESSSPSGMTIINGSPALTTPPTV